MNVYMWKVCRLCMACQWQVCSACAACVRQVWDMYMACLGCVQGEFHMHVECVQYPCSMCIVFAPDAYKLKYIKFDRKVRNQISVVDKRAVPDTASYIRGWMQMVLAPNDLFSWNNKYSKYTVTLLPTLQWIYSLFFSYARHHSLCACWHSWAVKGSSSSFLIRSLISLWVTSSLLLCL